MNFDKDIYLWLSPYLLWAIGQESTLTLCSIPESGHDEAPNIRRDVHGMDRQKISQEKPLRCVCTKSAFTTFVERFSVSVVKEQCRRSFWSLTHREKRRNMSTDEDDFEIIDADGSVHTSDSTDAEQADDEDTE